MRRSFRNLFTFNVIDIVLSQRCACREMYGRNTTKILEEAPAIWSQPVSLTSHSSPWGETPRKQSEMTKRIRNFSLPSLFSRRNRVSMPASFDANRRARTTIVPFRAGDMEQTRHSICHQRSAFPPWQTRPGECHASAVAGKHTRLACSLAISLRALVCVGGEKKEKRKKKFLSLRISITG